MGYQCGKVWTPPHHAKKGFYMARRCKNLLIIPKWNIGMATRGLNLLIMPKWVINVARRCGHLHVMPKLIIKLTTIENEHIYLFLRVVRWR
jgi:hypothetical protein